jgi:uncharacterized protein YndB with AHSA1/START domain
MQVSDSSAAADREILTVRTFDAPRELVYKAWTDPRHLVHWWGPNGFTTRVYQMDVKPGGVWRLVMRGPDGRDYHNKFVFHEVVEPERLVYQYTEEPGCEPANFRVTVTFDADGPQRTKVTMRMVFPTAEARDEVVKKYGALEGAKQTYQRLADHLAAVVSGERDIPDSPRRCEITLTRVINAPRKRVFEAWVDPQHVAKWWGPAGFTNEVRKWEARPDGEIELSMRAPDGYSHPMTGVFHEIVPPERLVFTAVAEDDAGNRLLESHTTVTFVDEGGKTKLTVHAKAVGFVPLAANMLAGMEQGWSQSLERLNEFAHEY